LLGACFVFVLSKPVLAEFDVVDGSDGKFYGNAQNSTFKSAVEGFDSLDESDKAFLANVEEGRVDHRWYARLLLGQPRTTLKNIKNTSSGGAFLSPITGLPVAYAAGVPITEVQSKDDLFTGLLAWGYRWRKWALEMEWVFSETLKYNASPIAPTVPMNVQADITRLAMLANVEYTFDRWFDFHPSNLGIYVLAGAGGSYYASDTTTLYLNSQPRLSDSTTKTNFIWQLGIGARVQISSHVLIEATYRYVDLGKVKFGPLDSGLSFQADKNKTTGAFLGLTYQL
tara:strand:- start:2881 stop:3732 length:852 start_codon:yes stop_codon:yes gene_type:complete